MNSTIQGMRGALAAAAALWLAGCASTPKDIGPYGAGVSQGQGPQSAPIAAGNEYKFQADLNRRVSDLLLRDPEGLILPMPRSDGLSQIRINEDAFKPGSGELLPVAVDTLGKLAQTLQTTGGCVIHVLGERKPNQPAGGADLGERRSTAVAAVLAQLGLPPTRIRAESRVQPGSADGVILVIRPVVAGHEEEAYMPPQVEG